MGGKDQQGDELDFEFYLADDMQELELDFEGESATPPTVESAKRGLADRVPKGLSQRAKRPKKMTALEALAALEAEEAEKKRAAAEKAQRIEKARLAKKLAEEAAARIELQRIEEEERSAAEEAEWARQAFGSKSGPGVPVAGVRRSPDLVPTLDEDPGELPEGAEVLQTWNAFNEGVVLPLMASHEARAQHEGDLSAAIAFGRLREALSNELIPVEAARVRFGGTDWAVWFADGEPVAVLKPADLYLVGL